MAKKQDEIVKSQPTSIVPDYLVNAMAGDTSLETTKEYYVLSRVKIVQGTAKKELKDAYGEGAVILWPGNVEIATKDAPFQFQPLFFGVEFCHWSDLDDTNSPIIRERTTDKTSEIARKARDNKLRYEGYGGPGNKKPEGAVGPGSAYLSRYVEHLNFIGYVSDPGHPLYRSPIALGFSRGEFNQGKNLLTQIQLRKMPLWSQNWQFNSVFRDKGAKKKFWGLDFSVPQDRPHISIEDVAWHREQFEMFKEMYNAGRVQVDLNDKDVVDEEAVKAARENQDM